MNLELQWKSRMFSGEYPTLIFDFLTWLLKEVDTLEISEGHFMGLFLHQLPAIPVINTVLQETDDV